MTTKTHPPLVICEGEQEMEFACQLCIDLVIGTNVFKLNANGNSKYKVIASKIFGHVEASETPYSSIIVLFDREENEDSPEQIIKCVEEELKNLGHNLENTIIGVADPYIESWMLPFVSTDGEFPIIPQGGCDGTRTEGELKKRLKKRRYSYNKKKIGVEILNAIDPQKLADVSESFKNFYNQTKIKCNW